MSPQRPRRVAGGDCAAATPEDLARALLRHERPAWDLLPAFGPVFRQAGGLIAWALPSPDWLWTAHPPHAAVRAAGRALASAVRTAPGPLRADFARELVGCWLVCESWAAPRCQAGELRRRHAVGGSTPRFETLPGAVERRESLLVDLDGAVTWVGLERESGEVGLGDGASGRVVDALRAAAVEVAAALGSR